MGCYVHVCMVAGRRARAPPPLFSFCFFETIHDVICSSAQCFDKALKRRDNDINGLITVAPTLGCVQTTMFEDASHASNVAWPLISVDPVIDHRDGRPND